MVNIDREHPEYTAKKAMWKKYRDLYAGGEQMRENAFEYLVRRHKEPNDIYAERLSRVFYENYIGSIIDWYAATLMRREAALLFDGNDEAAKSFYNVLAEDCDLKGTQHRGVLPAADRADAGAGAELHRGGLSAVAQLRQQPGGRGRRGAFAGVPGGLLAGGAHQLELRRSRGTGVGGHPDLIAAQVEGHGERMDA